MVQLQGSGNLCMLTDNSVNRQHWIPEGGEEEREGERKGSKKNQMGGREGGK